MKPVIVTTSHRLIAFGYAEDTSGDTITLKDARCVLYYTTETGGFFGLASRGPASGSRLSAKTPEIELRSVTSVQQCSDEAVKVYEEWK